VCNLHAGDRCYEKKEGQVLCLCLTTSEIIRYIFGSISPFIILPICICIFVLLGLSKSEYDSVVTDLHRRVDTPSRSLSTNSLTNTTSESTKRFFRCAHERDRFNLENWVPSGKGQLHSVYSKTELYTLTTHHHSCLSMGRLPSLVANLWLEPKYVWKL
jgi:hypothetical protein